MTLFAAGKSDKDALWKMCLRAGVVAVGLATLCGCSPTVQNPSNLLTGNALKGQVHGGQQPVVGASIELYAAGATIRGAGALDLTSSAHVVTDETGAFSITGDYVCPSSTTQVYMVARGGNPGLPNGGSNPAILLVAALGDCGSLSSASFITINEVTTAAAAWALSQFAGRAANIGSSPTNTIGLRNAFAVAANLADPTTGTAPGSALPRGAVAESAKLNTFADVLASCVNSDGGSPCTPLFTAATNSTGKPDNTFEAALNIVRSPAVNVAAIFRSAGSRGPFQPTLLSPPSDWTMSITYSGAGLNLPASLAIDSVGNAVVANYFGAAVSKFSANGVPVSNTGFHGEDLNQSYGITVDRYDNIWVTNEQSISAAGNGRVGSVSEFTPSGVEISGSGIVGGGVYYPQAAAAAANGDIWIADYGSSAATLLSNNGSGVSGSNGYGASLLPFTSAVAVDGSSNGWFATQSGAVRVTPDGEVARFSCCSDPAGIATDQSGNVWVADYNGSSVTELGSDGAIKNNTVVLDGNAGPQGIAVDGNGNVWVANYYGNALVALSGPTAAVLSPAGGYGLDAPLDEPYGIAIDASGNLWFSNSGSSTITTIVGLAGPIRTPLLGPPVQP